ncbi:MAG: Trm112 family protein [Thermodesulfovibrionales bacterium]
MPISKELLDVLACPQCKGSVALSEEGNGLVCKNCQLLYPVREAIPIMRVEEAARIPSY